MIGSRKYVICFNEEQARNEARDWIAIVEPLRVAVTEGDRILVGTTATRNTFGIQAGIIPDSTKKSSAKRSKTGFGHQPPTGTRIAPSRKKQEFPAL